MIYRCKRCGKFKNAQPFRCSAEVEYVCNDHPEGDKIEDGLRQSCLIPCWDIVIYSIYGENK